MKRKTLILFSFGLLFAGCDKVCKNTIDEYVVVQNSTGRALSLSVCKGRSLGMANINVAQGMNDIEVKLGQREGTEVRGGPTASCSGVTDERQSVGISLAPNSYGQVKLCYDETSNKGNVKNFVAGVFNV